MVYFDKTILWRMVLFSQGLSGTKFRSKIATCPVPNSKPGQLKMLIWIKSANLNERNHCYFESWYNSNYNLDKVLSGSRNSVCNLNERNDKTTLWRTLKKFLLFSHGLFRNENSTKDSNLTVMNFFAGNIHLMLYSGQVGNLNR